MSKVKNEHEQNMARLNQSVVTIKNISNEDFQHMYAGVPYILKAGETLPFVYPVGMLMAKHLARRIIREKAIADGKMKKDSPTHNLYSEIRPLIDKIIINKEDKPLPEEKSEGEVMKEKTVEMQKQFKKEEEKKAVVVTKNEIIKELRKRNIRFNSRDTKEELLVVLNEADMAENTGDEK